MRENDTEIYKRRRQYTGGKKSDKSNFIEGFCIERKHQPVFHRQ